ncbi:MAG: cytochrome d ubiquinol oxidase subunit II [Desulfomonilia bacterium]|jgi:cytochrome d ubiquinol oxidase subunit II
MDVTWLPLFWAGLIAFAMFVYVVLDGYDLGIGILSGTTRNEAYRDAMVNAVSPFWDGNEVWLVLIGASLFGAFPMVYAIFLPAFYLPIALMLLALIFRGVAIEFRYHAKQMRRLWDSGFFLGSLIASFVQGAAIGRMVQELPVAGGQYAGSAFEWLTPFSVLCGIGLAIGYTLLGAAWLVLKTDGALRDWAYRRLGRLLAGVLMILLIVAVFALTTHLQVRDRWLQHLWLVIFPLIIFLASIGLWLGVRRRSDRVPYAMAVLIFLAAFLSLAGSFWPYMIPFTVTIETAAAPVQSLRFLFYGAGIIVFPVVLIYTGVVYWVLRGKV